MAYLPYETTLGRKTLQWLQNAVFQLQRPTQVARGQYQPRPGLSSSQNAYIDILGLDDRRLGTEDTKMGLDYWHRELTQVQPYLDDVFREDHLEVAAMPFHMKWLMRNHAFRQTVETSLAEAATDPLMIIPQVWKVGHGIWKAARYATFNAGALPNYPLIGRMYNNMEIKPTARSLSQIYKEVAPPSRTGQVILNPAISTSNHALDEAITKRVYGAYQARPQIQSREQLLPTSKSEQLTTPMKPGQISKHPDKMDSHEYIDWMLTPVDDLHRQRLIEAAQNRWGNIGNYLFDSAPLAHGTLIPPDIRPDAMTTPGVPVRSDAGEAFETGANDGLATPPESASLAVRTRFDSAVARHAGLAGRKSEVGRIAGAGVYSYYSRVYENPQARSYFGTYRIGGEEGKSARDKLIEDPAMLQLHNEFLNDKSTGADRLRAGRLPSELDLSDFESVLYWTGDKGDIKSPMLRSIIKGEIADLPWTLKPAGRRHIGYMSYDKPIPTNRAKSSEELFRDNMRAWYDDTGKYTVGKPEYDMGLIFDETVLKGDLRGTYESLRPVLAQHPEYRDMFFNPANGNVYELKDYLKYSDPGFLRDAEALRFDSGKKEPYTPRYTARYPLVTLPGGTRIGPTYGLSEDGSLMPNVNSLRTHMEVQRVGDALLRDRDPRRFNKVVNDYVVPELYNSGFTSSEGPMYDPYHGYVYGQDVLDRTINDSMQQFNRTLNAMPNGERKNELTEVLKGARSYLGTMMRHQMVGTEPTTNGAKTFLQRSVENRWTPNDTYTIPSDFVSKEEDVFNMLLSNKEFQGLEYELPSDRLPTHIASTKKKRVLRPEFINGLQRGLVEQNATNPLFDSTTYDNFVEAGALVAAHTPIAEEGRSDVYLFHAPTMVPATADMIVRDITDLAQMWSYHVNRNSFSEEALMKEMDAGRNVLGAPTHIADRSLTSMINRSLQVYDRAKGTTNADILDSMPLMKADEATNKFFQTLRHTSEDSKTILSEMVDKSITQSDYGIALQSDRSIDMGELQQSAVWPKGQYRIQIELPEHADTWTAQGVLTEYSNSVRSMFLQHPEIMSLNLASAYEQLLQSVGSTSTENAVKGINAVMENLLYDIMPNYEMCVGQDPISRTHAMHIVGTVATLKPEEFAQQLPEIVKDVKALIYRMDGTFGANQEGLLLQTMLRSMQLPTESKTAVMDFVTGYTTNVLSTAESVTGHMREAMQQMVNRYHVGADLTSGVNYDVKAEDIGDLRNNIGRVDKPIRMDPSALGMSSKVGLYVEHTDKVIRGMLKEGKPLTPYQVQYLKHAIDNIDKVMYEMQMTVNEHILEATYNLAYDPSMDPEDMQMMFRTQPTVINAIADNPAALAIANKWKTGIDRTAATKTINSALAMGTITQQEAAGLNTLADFQDYNMRNKMTDVLFDVYAAHRPIETPYNLDAVMAFRGSKYGPDMQAIVQRIQEDPPFAELVLSKAFTSNDMNAVRAVEVLADRLDIPLLPFAYVMFQDYSAAATTAFDMMKAVMVDLVRQKN